MKIRLIGQRNHLGIGVHFGQFADALRRMSYLGNLVEEIDCQDQTALLAAAERSEPQDINICFVAMHLQDHFRGTNIQWVVFESTRVPPSIMPTMLAADQVWVPSAWGRRILIENGAAAERCHVVSEGVNSARYHPYYPRVESPILTYLISGKYELRKSIIETVYAWMQEFGNDPQVELVVKSNYFVNQEAKYNELSGWIESSGIKNIRILWGSINADEMVDLYQQSHVFVLPTKGEGWGLPLIEAAATGLPIISTMHSGQSEFLQHIKSSVIPVEFDMAPITCQEYQFYYPTDDGNWGEWAQPRIDSIRCALRASRDNYHALQAQAVANSHVIREVFSWERSVDHALKILHDQDLLKM
jgi:glycosyltransferase involved in cell wall biosynthesis